MIANQDSFRQDTAGSSTCKMDISLYSVNIHGAILHQSQTLTPTLICNFPHPLSRTIARILTLPTLFS